MEVKPTVMMDNQGGTYAYNRAARRQRLKKARNVVIDYVDVPENQFTKSTHKIKKLRSKNAKRKEYRQRKLARVRKAGQEDNSQVS